MIVIPRSFYRRHTVDVAKDLLGALLVRRIGKKMISGTITETEAYGYRDDPASHSFRGMTARNRAMFGQVGMAYVYFTYGMHYCVNVVARDDASDAGAVLIRAISPKDGIDFMIKQRGTSTLSNLANGPAKLTQALKITNDQYGEDLTRISGLYLLKGETIRDSEIKKGPRVGIQKAKDLLWNFSVEKKIT